MRHMISWFEIPSADFARATAFYAAILDVEINEIEIDGTRMGLLPMDGENISGAISHGEGWTPGTDGALVYLNGGDDLQIVLDRVEQNGGRVVVPKTEISAEMGFFGLFMDTEGNRVGVHSMQ